jgi:chromodomain-helicase-DNA-binding protein 7
MEKQERMETIVREREAKRVEMQHRRFSKREEADFYRTIASYGLEYNR